MLPQLIDNLNGDLANEYSHLHFYLHASIRVKGLHREELREFFYEQAQSEMNHVRQFAEMIQGLGGTPTVQVASFPTHLTDPADLVSYALSMEKQVLSNFKARMDQAESLEKIDGFNGRWIVVFLEKQMEDTRHDVDHLMMMLK